LFASPVGTQSQLVGTRQQDKRAALHLIQSSSALRNEADIRVAMNRILRAIGRPMLDAPRSKTIEWKIIQSYIWVLRAPRDVDGHKTCSLARHGAYEVRLIEPSEMPRGDAIPFWIELFDHERKTTLDSFGNDDLEVVAISAAALIAEAEMLHRHPTRRWWRLNSRR
jgi:hypothetical protein